MKIILLLCFLATPFVAAADPQSDACLSSVRADLRLAWPQNHTINIVTFGHSVPAGYFVTPAVHTREAYPRLVADALAGVYPTAVVNVITSAVGGETSAQGIQRFRTEVLGHSPRVVTIDYGLNDRGLPIAQSRANLLTMIREARTAGSCVVLLTPSPDLGGEPPAAKSTLSEQVSMIRSLAEEEGVPMADVYAAFIAYKGRPQELMAQPNHPGEKGHQLIATEILKLLK
jgi:acyl-CoA thioesterase-1